MSKKLPEKLFDAEAQIYDSLLKSFTNKNTTRIAVDIRFEGLRLMPIGIRLSKKLIDYKYKPLLAFGDAGSTALARRESPELGTNIKSFKEIMDNKLDESFCNPIIAIAPQPYDYEEFEAMCNDYRGIVIMLNGKLDDSEVGIGSVARDRRKKFIMKWENIYWLQPFKNSALLHSYPSDWTLFKQTDNGFIEHEVFEKKPNSEEIFESLL